MKKTILIIAIAVLVIFGSFLVAKPNVRVSESGVAKIFVYAHPYQIEITPNLARDISSNKERAITRAEFEDIAQVVLSDEFKNLEDEYKAYIPSGSACTQAHIIITVTYKNTTTKTVVGEGCSKFPKVINIVYGKAFKLANIT